MTNQESIRCILTRSGATDTFTSLYIDHHCTKMTGIMKQPFKGLSVYIAVS